MARKSSKAQGTTTTKSLDVKLKRPFLTGLMLALGFGLGSALLGLLTIAAPIVYMYVQGLLG